MFYIAQGALFLGVVQIVVYTGAMMMLFLFVLMLVGVDSSDSLVETMRGQRVAAIVVGVGFGVLLIAGIGSVSANGFTGLAEANAGGNVQGLAALIFTQYVLAFEVTSALLITAALGAMVLAHRERSSGARRSASWPTSASCRADTRRTLPDPGVYARHNAVDIAGPPARRLRVRAVRQRGPRRSEPSARPTAVGGRLDESATTTSTCRRCCSRSARPACWCAATRSSCSCASS